ncbi:MAG: hypothetical protein AAGG09_06210 [Pseudomonadota bacterium]
MQLIPFLMRTLASLSLAYVLFILWMGAGLLPVLAFASLLHGGLSLARHGDRPLEQWPVLRRVLARRRPHLPAADVRPHRRA